MLKLKRFIPYILLASLIFICKIAWDLEDSLLALFYPVTLSPVPYAIIYISYSEEVTRFSYNPTIFTSYLESSLGTKIVLLFNKSNNFPQYIS